MEWFNNNSTISLNNGVIWQPKEPSIMISKTNNNVYLNEKLGFPIILDQKVSNIGSIEKGATIGAMIGGAMGWLIAHSFGESSSHSFQFNTTSNESLRLGEIIGTLGGTLIGGIIGAGISIPINSD